MAATSPLSSSGLLSLQTQSRLAPLQRLVLLPTTINDHNNKKNAFDRRRSARCATQSANLQPGGGTRYVGGKRVKVLQVGDKTANLRDKVSGDPPSVKLLSRVQQLRLLSKAEKAGLLSAAEKAGFSLSTIEKLGLLSKAEELGVLTAATDPSTPGSLLTLALLLLVAGPAFVYVVPEDAVWEIVLQVLVALGTIVGGSAAFAASSFVSSLQKSE